MDIFAHVLWTLIFFYKYKYLRYALIIGILPDLLSWTIYAIYSLIKWAGFGKPILSSIPSWVFTLYGITHSIFVFSLIFLLVWLFIGKIPIILLPWLIHIIMDIPSHSREFLPTPFLWPFSNWYFPGISWGNPWFMLINYILISIFLSITLIQKENIFTIIKNFIKK